MIRWLFLVLVFCVASGAHAKQPATIVTTCGSLTLTPGGTANRTIDVNGNLCTAGGGAVTPPSNKVLLVNGSDGLLKTNGVDAVCLAGGC